MAHAGNTKIWAKIICAYAKKCSIAGFSSLRGGRGGKKRKYICDLISDPDVGKAFKYYAQYPGVMQGSQAENVLSYGARVPISEQTYS